MNDLAALQSLGLELPSPAYLMGAVLFGLLGYAAFRYGKKLPDARTKWLGIALMLFPYAIAETWELYAIGTALCSAIVYLRRSRS
jgi:hypothetical protein